MKQAEELLAQLSRAEKAQLLQWVVCDLGGSFPGIESLPNVCGGEPIIVRTCIPAWLLVQARHLKCSLAHRIGHASAPITLGYQYAGGVVGMVDSRSGIALSPPSAVSAPAPIPA